MIKKIQKKLYSFIKKYRLRFIIKLINNNSKTLLDIGCEDLFFYNHLSTKYKVTLADYSPKNKNIKKEDVQNLSFSDDSFDTVLCQEVLEHIYNPIKAISELKRVTKKQLIISVPYEPFFTIFRFLNWEKEHLWAIRPKVLRHYLGKPAYETTFFFKRYYIAVWIFD